jgi:Uma2 family endonuclease
VHYYDQHPTEEDLMGESAAQSQLIFYLLQVLEWLYRAERCFVVSNLNIYRRRDRYEYPLAPDVAVFKGVVIPNRAVRDLHSWRLYQPDRPAPRVVFEISSDTTWKDDLEAKPAKYAAMGVQEYYAYDPNDPPYWPGAGGRLRGWRLHEGTMVEVTCDPQARLWSDELASWLVPDGALLRLVDSAGQQRLTEGEAERAAREAERAAKEAAWARLRELGIDPNDL